MDWLLHNPIADMPAPRFFVFYAIVVMVTVFGCWLSLCAADHSKDRAPPPVPSNPDPYEIAYLRGGENEVMRVAVFSLIQRGYLRVAEERDSPDEKIRRLPNHPDPRHLSRIERQAFDWFEAPQTAREIFQSPGLAPRLKEVCTPLETRLRASSLLMLSEARTTARIIGFLAGLFLAGLGAYRLLVIPARDHFHEASIILVGVGGVVLLAIACRVPRMSHRGRAYLGRLQLAFEHLKGRAIVASAKSPDPALLLAVGLFGVGVLAGTPHRTFRRMFRKAGSRSGSCGGGCSSWSGWGWSCGSASCGSGGSCGGGGGCSGGGGSCGGGCGGGDCGGGGS